MRVNAIDNIFRTSTYYQPLIRRPNLATAQGIEKKVSQPVQHPVKLPSFDAHGRLMPVKHTNDNKVGNYLDAYV